MYGIDLSLAYIKQNLKTHITTDELAEIAGYSVWHFGRLFATATGRTISAYICKCRLDAALQEMAMGAKAVDVAFDYGFDTYAGFYKAFVRMYGISPKKYLSLYGKWEANMLREHELRVALGHWDAPQGLELKNISADDGAKVKENVWRYGEDLILKTADRDLVLRDLKLRKALTKQGFITSSALLTKTGSEYLDGERVFTLSHKIKGIPLPDVDRFGESRQEFGRKCGKALANLHLALKDVEADVMPDDKDVYKQATEWAKKLDLPADVTDDYKENFGKLAGKLPKQLIHRDPNPANILFDNGEVTGFIDFDISERNIRLFDVCYLATGILAKWEYGDKDIRDKWLLILSGVLFGYDEVSPLTDEEKQAVYYVILSIQLIFVAYCEGFDSPEMKQLAKINREMLDYIIGIKDQIKAIF
ncbi:MAG: helix-turn-helix domain-containing protein [Defluviitaleaceae bacterium]|nr:helix-turn-helix domain-containing protein [Defluviitaleaceae bacterium]